MRFIYGKDFDMLFATILYYEFGLGHKLYLPKWIWGIGIFEAISEAISGIPRMIDTLFVKILPLF